MKILAYFEKIPQLFDWYFRLPQLKRIQFNYIVLLVAIIAAAYYNDKRHRDNYNILSARVDTVNDLRAKEQEGYKKSLEFYTDKFNNLLEKLILSDKGSEKINSEK
ncbi:hypothetical protein ACI6PS_02480 [Flavobacterium sp. PLA-1-15]|uniref:hypothetical protein n=1 Tax=Flavobacterium sp. PLA-1-15 TaxID=3380533 RepID=UPI003B7B65B5